MELYWKDTCKNILQRVIKSWESQRTDRNKNVLNNNIGEYRTLRTVVNERTDKQ